MSQLDGVQYTKGKAAIPVLCVPPVFFGVTLSKLALLYWVPKGKQKTALLVSSPTCTSVTELV